MNTLFKESFTEYNQGSENTLSGPQSAFASSLLEGIDASRNTYNYNSYYKTDNHVHDRRQFEKKEVKKEDKKEEHLDNSLLFMGLGVAALGATVIVVMALRK
jgi:hypothetical protein